MDNPTWAETRKRLAEAFGALDPAARKRVLVDVMIACGAPVCAAYLAVTGRYPDIALVEREMSENFEMQRIDAIVEQLLEDVDVDF